MASCFPSIASLVIVTTCSWLAPPHFSTCVSWTRHSISAVMFLFYESHRHILFCRSSLCHVFKGLKFFILWFPLTLCGCFLLAFGSCSSVWVLTAMHLWASFKLPINQKKKISKYICTIKKIQVSIQFIGRDEPNRTQWHYFDETGIIGFKVKMLGQNLQFDPRSCLCSIFLVLWTVGLLLSCDESQHEGQCSDGSKSGATLINFFWVLNLLTPLHFDNSCSYSCSALGRWPYSNNHNN